MKKYFLLASFVAVVLMINQVSFAADEVVVADAPEPCSCCYCTATAQAMPMPFACPPAPQKMFGAKLKTLLSQCPLKHRAPAAFPCGPVPCDPCAVPAPVAMPCDPCAAPCPEPRPFRAAFAARRAARLAQPPFACPPAPMMHAPMMGPAPVAVPPVAVPPVGFAPAEMPGFSASVGQTGRVNYMSQRAAAPVINFLSVVRAPRAQYDPYAAAAGGFYQVPVAPQTVPTPAQ